MEKNSEEKLCRGINQWNGSYKNVDQFNNEGKNVTVDKKNVTENRIQRKKSGMKKKKFVVSRNRFVLVKYVLKY